MIRRLFCLLLFLATVAAHASPQILFVGYDAGETNIWIQLLSGWEKAEEAELLTLSTATKVAQDARVPHQLQWEGVSSNRLEEISDLSQLNAINVPTVAIGMYSAPSRQIAEYYAKKGSKVIAIWDNFSTFDKLPSELVANVERIVAAATAILTPSLEIASDLNSRFSTQKAIPMGQPTLEVWEKAIKSVDCTQALAKLSLRSDIPIITYISGYEEKNNNYNASFALFAKSLTLLKRPVQLIVQLHPRSDGAYERGVLSALAKEHPQYPAYAIGHPLTTFESVALSSLGVCHRSTVAIQALFAGKRFIHVDVPETAFSHFAMEKGLIAQLHCPEEIAKYLEGHLDGEVDVATLYEKGGIVPGATQKFRDFLSPCLSHADPE
ncbi:MAG: hypothetical protein V4492_06200 [Chlamydiota bacterium]